MDKAFLELLEKKDFAFITVKEICEKAGVNRSTFYLHYETIGDLLEESVEYMNAHFLKFMEHDSHTFISKLRSCPMEELYLITPEYLTPYLRYVSEHRRLFRISMDNATVLRLDRSYSQMFRCIFTPILERCGVPEQEREYIMLFYIRGLVAVIDMWLKNDCTEPIEQIIAIIQKCIPNKKENNLMRN